MTESAPTDAELVRSVLEDNERAREQLLDRHLPQVLQWCARLGGPLVDPEDAAQDVFIVVLTRLGQLRDPEAFRPWLFGVVRRVLAKHRRRVWLKRWVGDVPEGALHPGQGPDELAASREEGRQVHEALDALPRAQREALVLCDLEGHSTREAAELLGIPSGTVKSRLRLGRARFRKEAARQGLSLAWSLP